MAPWLRLEKKKKKKWLYANVQVCKWTLITVSFNRDLVVIYHEILSYMKYG